MANSPLQTTPRGLLGAFALQTLGRNPELFSDTVVPVVDILAFYGLDAIAITSAQQPVQTNAQLATITVPTGEVWRLRAMSSVLIVPTGDTINSPTLGLTCGVNNNNSSGAIRTSRTIVQAPSAALTEDFMVVDTFVPPAPFLLRSGMQLTGMLIGDLSAQRTLFLDCMIERYPQ